MTQGLLLMGAILLVVDDVAIGRTSRVAGLCWSAILLALLFGEAYCNGRLDERKAVKVQTEPVGFDPHTFLAGIVDAGDRARTVAAAERQKLVADGLDEHMANTAYLNIYLGVMHEGVHQAADR